MEALIGHLPRTHTQLYSDTESLNHRFLTNGKVYNSLDDIPDVGSCFGVIEKSISINTVSIPAYSRFVFINTGKSTDGALLAVDSLGNTYSAYRTSKTWDQCNNLATRGDLKRITNITSLSKVTQTGIYCGKLFNTTGWQIGLVIVQSDNASIAIGCDTENAIFYYATKSTAADSWTIKKIS